MHNPRPSHTYAILFQQKAPAEIIDKGLKLNSMLLVAGEGFEPSTFGL